MNYWNYMSKRTREDCIIRCNESDRFELSLGLTEDLLGNCLPSSDGPFTHWVMRLATPTFSPLASWLRQQRIRWDAVLKLFSVFYKLHCTVCCGFPTLHVAPLVGLWIQASPASNRFFLEATTSGELGRSVTAAFTARVSCEFYA